MAVIGTSRKFFQGFKFLVEIDGLTYAGFQKASGLSMEVAKIEHSEGGSLIPDKQPGRVTYEDITLERGATTDRELYDWMVEVANIVANAGAVAPAFKREADLVQQDRDGSELARWRISGAWPTKFEPGEWDNESDSVVIEKVTLAIDYFIRL